MTLSSALPGLPGLGATSTALNTEVEILRSRRLLTQVVDKLDLTTEPEFNSALQNPGGLAAVLARLPIALPPRAPHPEIDGAAVRALTTDRLEEAVSVRTIPDTMILEVTVESSRAALAGHVANSLADIYLADQRQARADAAAQAATWLGERVAALGERLQEAEARAAAHTSRMELISPRDLVALSTRVKALRAHIARQGGGEPIPPPGAAGGEGDMAGNGAAQLTPRLAQLRALEARLETRQARQTADLQRMAELEREVEASRLVHGYFLSRYQEALVQSESGRTESRLLSRAEVPISPAQPQPILVILLAGTLAGLAMAARLVLREARRDGFRSLQDLEQTGLPVLGQTLRPGRLKRAPLRFLPPPKQPLPSYVEGLKTALQRQVPETRLLVVTAPLEGRSTARLAAALCAGFGEEGHRVLLLDLDDSLRGSWPKNTLRRAFALAREGQDPARAAIPIAKLRARILTGSSSDRKSAELRALIHRLQSRFDVIIVLAPPILRNLRAAWLAEEASALVCAVAWEVCSADILNRASRELERQGGCIDGVVLTDVRPRQMRAMGYAEYGRRRSSRC